MHTGEEWFQLGWPQYVFVGAIVIVYLLLVFTKNLPSMKSFQDFTDTINSAGGHIIVLSIFSAWFFMNAMRFFFHVLGLPDEVITKHDAIIMTGVGFLTGTAFGGAWGALIKTMSGGKANGTSPVPQSSSSGDPGLPTGLDKVIADAPQPTPAAPPSATVVQTGSIGFAPTVPGGGNIGDAGDRGDKGDAGTMNRNQT